MMNNLIRRAPYTRSPTSMRTNLASALAHKPWSTDQGIDALVETLADHLPTYHVRSHREMEPEIAPIDQQIAPKQFIIIKLVNKEWRVGIEFFTSNEMQSLISYIKQLQEYKLTGSFK